MLLYIALLWVFSLCAMEESDTERCPFPWKTRSNPPDIESIDSSSSTSSFSEEDDPELVTFSEQAIRLCFDGKEEDDGRYLTLSRDVIKHIQVRLKEKSERRKSLRRVFEEEESDDIDPASSFELRKQIKDIVATSIEEALKQKEDRIEAQKLQIARQKNKIRLALIGACTTIVTTAIATGAAILSNFS